MSKMHFRARRGASLVEALVALLVMAFGMMAVAGIQGRLRYSGDAAKQRAEATRIASAEMERLRAYGAITRTDDTPEDVLVLNEITNANSTVEATSTEYKLARTVTPLADGSLEVTLNVSWLDRTKDDKDAAMSLEWKTAIPNVDPKLAVAAFIPPDFGVAQRRSQDRHPAIPSGAKKLSNDRSVFKPLPNGTVALVFNNHTGMVLQQCAVAAGLSTGQLVTEDLDDCPIAYAGGAYLLSGHVVYDSSDKPNPGQPTGAVIPVGVAMNLTSLTHPNPPTCFTDASANAMAGISALDYYCVIEPRTPPGGDKDKTLYWSGRSTLTGLLLKEGGQRVCRYSDDYNGDGSVGNSEHPDSYTKVTESLSNQNFLVVAFAASCPGGTKVSIEKQIYRNTVTAAHQP